MVSKFSPSVLFIICLNAPHCADSYTVSKLSTARMGSSGTIVYHTPQGLIYATPTTGIEAMSDSSATYLVDNGT